MNCKIYFVISLEHDDTSTEFSVDFPWYVIDNNCTWPMMPGSLFFPSHLLRVSTHTLVITSHHGTGTDSHLLTPERPGNELFGIWATAVDCNIGNYTHWCNAGSYRIFAFCVVHKRVEPIAVTSVITRFTHIYRHRYSEHNGPGKFAQRFVMCA